MAVPSRRPSTACTCTLGLPSGPTAISPTKEATSTCSSTGIGRYCFDSQSKNARVAPLKAPIAVTCDAPSLSLNGEILEAAHRFVALLHREGAFAFRLMKQFALHALPPFAAVPKRRELSMALEMLAARSCISALALVGRSRRCGVFGSSD